MYREGKKKLKKEIYYKIKKENDKKKNWRRLKKGKGQKN